MKRFLLIAISVIVIFTLSSAAWYLSALNLHKRSNHVAAAAVNNTVVLKLKERAPRLLSYAAKNGYNTGICLLVNMSLESGTNRFFMYDLQNDSVLDAGLVTHGSCNKDWLTGRQYGNTPGCNCTSLGKYKIGKPYYGKFGRSYKLYGLDSTNSNAFKRFVVLHSLTCVPDSEVYPYPICQSYGCPAVSPAFLKKLAVTIDSSSRPILLWIFAD
jgi:hypothetical protein